MIRLDGCLPGCVSNGSPPDSRILGFSSSSSFQIHNKENWCSLMMYTAGTIDDYRTRILMPRDLLILPFLSLRVTRAQHEKQVNLGIIML